MARTLKAELRERDPHMVAMLDTFERLGHGHDYYQIFSDLLDYSLGEFGLGTVGQPHDLGRYSPAEQQAFTDMLQAALGYVRTRANLWTGLRSPSGWADPFGTLFETLAGDMKKAAQGLFFTPESLCTMMAQMVVRPDGAPGETLAEPACGSGRLVLAANAVNPGLYCCANDIDPACTKMTALNMAFNGAVGEVSCMDGLWPVEDTWRFGYRVMPLKFVIENLGGLGIAIQAVAAIRSGGQYLKTYVIAPLAFEDCRMAAPAPGSGLPQIVENCAQVRTEHDVPTFEHLCREVLPTGQQGRLFD